MKYVQPYGISDPNAPYINGDPSIGRQGSIPPAAAFEHPMREIMGVIEKSGELPSSTDLLQLVKGIRSQYINFAVDTGSVNNISCAFDPPLIAYTPGLIIRVRLINTNTGSTTIDAGAGRAQIKRMDGLALQAGNLPAGGVATFVYDGTAFQLLNFLGTGVSESITINNLSLPYAVDQSSTPNTVNPVFNPPITSLVPGTALLVRIANNNTGPTLMYVNSLAPVYILSNGTANHLVANDIAKYDVKLCVFDGTYFWIQPNYLVRQYGAIACWVRTDGDDTYGDGTANTPAKAFRTIQRAYTAFGARYAPSPNTIIDIRLGIPGRYDGAFLGPYGGWIYITGDRSNRTVYEIGPTPGGNPQACVWANNCSVRLQGVNLVGDTPSDNWANARASSSSHLEIDTCQMELRGLGVCYGGFILSQFGSTAVIRGNGNPNDGCIIDGHGISSRFVIAASQSANFWGADLHDPATIVFYNTRSLDGWAGYVSDNLSAVHNNYLRTAQSGCYGPQWRVSDTSVIRAAGQSLPGDQSGVSTEYGLYFP